MYCLKMCLKYSGRDNINLGKCPKETIGPHLLNSYKIFICHQVIFMIYFFILFSTVTYQVILIIYFYLFFNTCGCISDKSEAGGQGRTTNTDVYKQKLKDGPICLHKLYKTVMSGVVLIQELSHVPILVGTTTGIFQCQRLEIGNSKLRLIGTHRIIE